MRTCTFIAALAGCSGLLSTQPALAGGPVASVGEMPGAIVLDIVQADLGVPLGPFVFGSGSGAVTATTMSRVISTGAIQDPAAPGFFNRGSTCTAIPAWCGGTDPAINPGDFMGRFTTDRELIITFDTPVAGAGLSFYSNGNGGTMSTGSTITAFDGPAGTGNVLGSVTSPDTEEECCPFTTPEPWYFIFFRGVTSDNSDIRSIVVTPTVASDGWGVDAIAVAPATDSPCPADVNGDGVATPADFTAWLGCFNDPGSAPFCDNADVNGSGAIDPADFTAWLAAFNAGCP